MESKSLVAPRPLKPSMAKTMSWRSTSSPSDNSNQPQSRSSNSSTAGSESDDELEGGVAPHLAAVQTAMVLTLTSHERLPVVAVADQLWYVHLGNSTQFVNPKATNFALELADAYEELSEIFRSTSPLDKDIVELGTPRSATPPLRVHNPLPFNGPFSCGADNAWFLSSSPLSPPTSLLLGERKGEPSKFQRGETPLVF